MKGWGQGEQLCSGHFEFEEMFTRQMEILEPGAQRSILAKEELSADRCELGQLRPWEWRGNAKRKTQKQSEGRERGGPGTERRDPIATFRG